MVREIAMRTMEMAAKNVSHLKSSPVQVKQERQNAINEYFNLKKQLK